MPESRAELEEKIAAQAAEIEALKSAAPVAVAVAAPEREFPHTMYRKGEGKESRPAATAEEGEALKADGWQYEVPEEWHAKYVPPTKK